MTGTTTDRVIPKSPGRPHKVKPPPSVAMAPERLKAWREGLNLSKTDLALKLGMSRNVVIKWEDGRSKIPDAIAYACAAISYGLPPLK